MPYSSILESVWDITFNRHEVTSFGEALKFIRLKEQVNKTEKHIETRILFVFLNTLEQDFSLPKSVFCLKSSIFVATYKKS